MKWPAAIKIYTDGASRGNPGPASIGVSFTTVKDEEVSTLSEAIGDQTNNFAEYTALIRGLEEAKVNKAEKIWIRTDSQLMVRQILGEYKVKSESIKDLHAQVIELLKFFEKVRVEHIPREQNKRADELANQALDKQFKGAKLFAYDDDFDS
ncbi:MAG: ribonuclease HI family protein [Bdellovibrionota bacterium]